MTVSFIEMLNEQAMRLMSAEGKDIATEVARSKGLSDMVRVAQDNVRIANDAKRVSLQALAMAAMSGDLEVKKAAKALVTGNGNA